MNYQQEIKKTELLKKFLLGEGILDNGVWKGLKKEYDYLHKKYSPKEFKNYIEIQNLIINLMMHYKKQQIKFLKELKQGKNENDKTN